MAGDNNNLNQGNYFSNQKAIADRLQNLDSNGDLTGANGAITAAVAGAAITTTGSRTFLTVTSANAAHWVTLPTPVIGDEVWLAVGANGCELRSSAPSTVLINAGTGGAAVESAIAADQLVRCVCTTALAWTCTNFAADGTESKLEAAA